MCSDLVTPLIAAFSEHYGARKWPLLLGQLCLAASQVMLMEVPTYWLMVISRVIQGVSSSVVWVVGLALLYDTFLHQNLDNNHDVSIDQL